MITIPPPIKARPSRSYDRAAIGLSRAPGGIAPCKITVSEENITLSGDGGDLAVIVGVDDVMDLEGMMGTSSSTKDVTVRREPITGIKSRALFVIRTISSRVGVYQVSFELPCGKKDIVVRVR